MELGPEGGRVDAHLRARAVVWRWYLGAMCGLGAAYFLLPAAQAKLIVWPAIGWSSVAAIVVGVRLHRPDARGAWYLLAAGVATFIVGDNLYSFRNYVQHDEVPFPSSSTSSTWRCTRC